MSRGRGGGEMPVGAARIIHPVFVGSEFVVQADGSVYRIRISGRRWTGEYDHSREKVYAPTITLRRYFGPDVDTTRRKALGKFFASPVRGWEPGSSKDACDRTAKERDARRNAVYPRLERLPRGLPEAA